MSILTPKPRDPKSRRSRDISVEVDTLASTIGAEVIVEVDDLTNPDPNSVRGADTTTPSESSLDLYLARALSRSPEEWQAQDARIAARTADLDLPATQPQPAPQPTYKVKTAADWIREADERAATADLTQTTSVEVTHPEPDSDSKDGPADGDPTDLGLAIFDHVPHTDAPTHAPRARGVTVVRRLSQVGVAATVSILALAGAAAAHDQWSMDQRTDRFCATAPTMSDADSQATFAALREGRPETARIYRPFAAGVAAFDAPSSGPLTGQVNAARGNLQAAHQALLETKGTIIVEARIDALAADLVAADAAFRSACALHRQ